MRGKRRKDMEVAIVIVTLCMLLGNTVANITVYNMDSALDCGYIGSQTIQRGQTLTVNAKTKDTSSSTQTGCTINFQTADNDATIRVDFQTFIINDCDVKLYLSGDGSGSMTTYSCRDNPSTYITVGRSLTLTLRRTRVTANQYCFQLQVTAVSGLAAATEKPCCVSKKWTGKLRITTASLANGTVTPVITENSFMIDYDRNLRMDKAVGIIRTYNGSMETTSDYTVYNDYRHMRRYAISSYDNKCNVEMLTEDQTDPCVPSELKSDGNYRIGSAGAGVHVNSWSGVYNNLQMKMLTTVNDCTPVQITRFGTTSDGTRLSEEIVFVDVTQYLTSGDAFKLPDTCQHEEVPVGK